MLSFLRPTLASLATAVESTNPGYFLSMGIKHGIWQPPPRPEAPWHNAVLKDRDEVDSAVREVTRLRLPVRRDTPKNWDSLAALDCILRNTSPSAAILDAGAERYSMILPWLSLYKYRRLYGINLGFERDFRRGPIRFSYGDVTNTDFPDDAFDAVTCLSVVEHGLDLRAYFQEMARILRPGGLLITSTDYWEPPIDTGGRAAYGAPVHIFCEEEIRSALGVASRMGFALTSALDLRCDRMAVRWNRQDLEFTFVIFTLRLSGE